MNRTKNQIKTKYPLHSNNEKPTSNSWKLNTKQNNLIDIRKTYINNKKKPNLWKWKRNFRVKWMKISKRHKKHLLMKERIYLLIHVSSRHTTRICSMNLWAWMSFKIILNILRLVLSQHKISFFASTRKY